MTSQQPAGQFAAINGLQMYHEIYGSGKPLVLVHGGGSIISSAFGHLIPVFARNHQVIAVEMQAHGRTADIDRPFTFEQDADDLAALLQHLTIDEADFMGFSNGGTTCLQLAIRHPQCVSKLVIASANFRRSGMQPGFWDGMHGATLNNMPESLKHDFLKVNPDPFALQAMFDRDLQRMLSFTDISDDLVRTIDVPALILNGDADVVTVEHALELSRMLPKGHLAVFPGGHGDYLVEVSDTEAGRALPALVAAMIEIFLTQ